MANSAAVSLPPDAVPVSSLPPDAVPAGLPSDAVSANAGAAPPRVGGQKVLDFANDTLSNIPGSAARLAVNIGHAIMHPIDTGAALLKTGIGTVQKMNPSAVPPTPQGQQSTSDFRPYADAAWQGLKDRYGSLDAIAHSIRTDPVGVAADISALAGGVEGAARGTAAMADAANLSRVAGGAGKVADVAGAVSDVTNPVNAVTKPVSAAMRGTARGVTKSALGLSGRTERYGATPAKAVLEETSGITPAAVRDSAIQRIKDLNAELESLARASTKEPSLAPARKVIEDEIARIQAANGIPDSALIEMRKQLTAPQPGFAGATEYPPGANTPVSFPTGATGQPLGMVRGKSPAQVVSEKQAPIDYLGMKRQFGDDFTKFDAAAPLKNKTLKTGNQAYHEMASEFNQAVPGAQPINNRLQGLIPARDAATRRAEGADLIQRSIDRATRPTGALAAVLMGLHEAGVGGGMLAWVAQEGLASPTVRMAIARTLYASGKAARSPMVSRALNAIGVSGEAAKGAQVNIDPDNLPHFATGGMAGLDGPEQIVVGEKEPELITPLSHIEDMAPHIQRQLMRGIGSHLGVRERLPIRRALGEELGRNIVKPFPRFKAR